MKKLLFITIPLVLLICLVTILILLSEKYRPDCPEKKSRLIQQAESDALEAILFWTRQRAYPFDHIKEDLFLQEFEKKRQDESRYTENKSAGWISIGPRNRGGRMISLAFSRSSICS